MLSVCARHNDVGQTFAFRIILSTNTGTSVPVLATKVILHAKH